MKIVSRFIYEGANCYNLESDGFIMISSERGLYEESVIQELTSSGYEYHDYHGTIYTPEGIRIQELIEVSCSATQNELMDMKEVEETCILSEAEATRYFKRTIEIKEVELKQPNITIHTREELLTYLQNTAKLSKLEVQDVRPLNSFVAREALFTIEELNSDGAIKRLYELICKRRVLYSMTSYKKLISFLQEEGVLKDEYTLIDVVKAYLSWGVCGINAKITDIYLKEGIFADINCLDDVADMTNDSAGLIPELCVYDKEGWVHSKHTRVNWKDTNYKEECEIQPCGSSQREYFRSLNSTSNWDSKYKTVPCMVREVHSRVYVEIMQDNGIKVVAKFDPSRFCITSSNIIYRGQFLQMRILDDRIVPIEKVASEEHLMIYNLCYALARDLIKERTIKTPVKSTVDLLKKEGFSLISATKYIAKQLCEDKRGINGTKDSQITYENAWRLYMNGPDSTMRKLFNPDDLSVSDFDELIEIMGVTRDKLIEEGKYPITGVEEINGVTVTGELLAINMPIEQLEFVRDIKQGQKTIDYMMAGRMLDNKRGQIDAIASVFEKIVSLELMRRPVKSYSDIQRVLRDIIKGVYVNLDELITVRDEEYKGYLRDRAILRANKAKEAFAYLWVTKVFREISNQKPEEQRHFMFECIDFPLDRKENKRELKIRDTLIDAITEAIETQVRLPLEYKEIMKEEIPSFAAKLIFKLILKKADYKEIGNNIVIYEKLTAERDKFVKLKISVESNSIMPLIDGTYLSNSYIKYSTVFDYASLEIDDNLHINMYCLNADITPWKVIPKDDYTFKSYNFPVNYYSGKEIVKHLPEVLINKIRETGGKVNNIRDSWAMNEVAQYDLRSLLSNYSPDTIDLTLDYENGETIDDYFNRWNWTRKKIIERKDGSTLIRIPLKSDVVFINYATVEDNIVEGNSEIKQVEDKREASYWLTQVDPIDLTNKISWNLITQKNKINEFKIEDYKFKDIERWVELVKDTFVCKAICFCIGYYLIIESSKENKSTIDLRIVTKQQMDDLVEKRIAYRLSATKYLLKANGQYVVEVA